MWICGYMIAEYVDMKAHGHMKIVSESTSGVFCAVNTTSRHFDCTVQSFVRWKLHMHVSASHPQLQVDEYVHR